MRIRRGSAKKTVQVPVDGLSSWDVQYGQLAGLTHPNTSRRAFLPGQPGTGTFVFTGLIAPLQRFGSAVGIGGTPRAGLPESGIEPVGISGLDGIGQWS